MSDPTDIRQAVSTAHPRRGYSFTFSLRGLILVIVILILCGASFLGGRAYQKSHTVAVAASTSNTSGTTGTGNGQFGGGFGGGNDNRRLGAIGQVTAISTSSITINNERTNASTTYSISSSTAITDNGQTVATTDIQVGDTVLISVASNDSTVATRILVSPSFGGDTSNGTGTNPGSN